MTNQSSTDFSGLVVSFLTDYLPLQRGCTVNTVRSYRDTIKLLLRFITDNRKVDLKNFLMKDLTRELVLDFLADYRKNGATSRSANQRLASLRSFCEF
ncbi:MAG: site-specific integrase, partial [Burkholderiales bacterium]|nr:site-specific integrase [Burkholderiales bacterium]